MPYVVMDIDEAILESLKGNLKGAFSEKTVQVGGKEHRVPVFDREIFMRDYMTLQSFLSQDVEWGK